MKLKIAYDLKAEEITDTIKNIKTSSNNLVKKVLAEETTFQKECKKLESYDKEEFYQKRDELADALNHYKFGEIIEEKEKTAFDYESLHEELKVLRKKKNIIKGITWSSWSSGAGGAGLGLFGAATGLIPVALIGIMAMLVGAGVGIGADNKLEKLRDNPKGFITIREYLVLEEKSVEADEFMQDFRFLKDNILPFYEDLRTDKEPKYIN
ncbi:MAG: hypothetical protein ISS23_01385 [Nanoarchaeota archaeon]|nr:hypothetical protein [Nanoarchaeota archaeon]